jgi:hypothetical protein
MWSISTGLPPPVNGVLRYPQLRQRVAGLLERTGEPAPREPESTRLRQYKLFLASGVQRQPYLNIP